MKLLKFLSVILLGAVITFQSVGCSKKQKPDSDISDEGLSQQERDEKARLAEENRQKSMARGRQMLIEHKSVDIANIDSVKINFRIRVNLVNKVKYLLYRTSATEEYDVQDMTDDIVSQFPNHYLEVSSYKFKSGSVDLVALQYNLMKTTGTRTDSASQFVLLILNKELGPAGVLKTQFEFPTRTNLRTWANKVAQATLRSSGDADWADPGASR